MKSQSAQTPLMQFLLKAKSSLILAVVFTGAVVSGHAAAATKTLTIKGGASEPGDTIEIPDTAEVGLSVHSDGIVITMPDLDLRLRCLGEATADGYCYVSAGSGTGSMADSDGDGVPDDWDACAGTTAPFTNSEGCDDADNDGVVGASDDCPNASGPASNNGCPVSAQTYTVTSSVSGGNGNINPAGSQQVESGRQVTFTLTPNSGYNVGSVGGTCGGNLSGSTFTVAAVSQDCTVVATFDQNSTDPVNASYCGGAGPSVDCDPNENMDTWGSGAYYAYYDAPIRRGRIRSFPFTYLAPNSKESGRIDVSSNMGTLLNHSFKMWISIGPNGDPISTKCTKYVSEALFKLSWSRGADTFTSCGLGNVEQVYHLNFAVVGQTTYNADFYFELNNY